MAWVYRGYLFRVRTYVSANPSHATDFKNLRSHNHSHNIQITQIKCMDGVYRYNVLIDGNVIHSVLSTSPRRFHDVQVFVASPWYGSAEDRVGIKNLHVYCKCVFIYRVTQKKHSCTLSIFAEKVDFQ